jgi:copper transport protein
MRPKGEATKKSTPRRRGLGFVVGASALALLWPSSAAAHAFLVRSDPAAGSEMARAPRSVRLFFDEGIRPAPGIEVVRNSGGSVLAGRPFVPAGKPTEIVLPLRPHIEHGDYTVRWREIDVDDGHLIAGVFAFGVGAAGAAPHAVLSAGSGNPPFAAVAGRWLLLAGLLVAAGTTLFGLLVWRPAVRAGEGELLAERLSRTEALILTPALALAALGAYLSVALVPGTSGTTFGHRMEIGAAVGAFAAVASLASFRVRALKPVVWLAALLLLALPTVTGHALQKGVPRGVSVPADLVHLASAAFWIGGSLALGLVLSFVVRLADEPFRQSGLALVSRYSRVAVVAVALVGLSGVTRAFEELSSFSQLWTTGYGRLLVAKTAVFSGLVVIGWLNRYRLTPALARSVDDGERGLSVVRRLRRNVLAELTALVVVVTLVAVLTNVRPGRDYASFHTAAPAVAPTSVVLAAQDRDLAVGIGVARLGSRISLRATVLGPNGPISRAGLRFIVEGDGSARFAAASSCGPGCYRASTPAVARLGSILLRIKRPGASPDTLTFVPPVRLPAPDASAIVRRATAEIHHLRTLVIHSRLASDPADRLTTTYKEVAPNRLEYLNSDGSASVIVGARRWDRASRHGPWREAPQDPPVREPVPFWPPGFTDAHVLRLTRLAGDPVWVVSFLDPATPAWFKLWVDRRTYQTLRLEMIATAHFMRNRMGSFDAPITVESPVRNR